MVFMTHPMAVAAPAAPAVLPMLTGWRRMNAPDPEGMELREPMPEHETRRRLQPTRRLFVAAADVRPRCRNRA